ncbi:amino acid adenylation domain-containing protein [Terasakiella pusilla]|uniref:amino acid adenylation domain-containing protein n=1 Tax=Terasakiella pusilla TaxID=64973 RepID=UPI003AA7CE9A
MNNNIVSFCLNAAAKYPNNPAIRDGEKEVSYADLVQQSQSLASIISSKEYRTLPVVVIFIDKSIEAVTGMMATLFAGKIYCPVDILSPRDRLISILNSIENFIILVDNNTESKAKEAVSSCLDGCVVNIDNINCNNNFLISQQKGDVLRKNSSMIDYDPAYIIFTSGSTGDPKGVTVSHANVFDYIHWANSVFEVDSSDIIGSQAPLFFDNSTLDIYLTFSNGACLDLISSNTFIFPKNIINILIERDITIIFWVPSLLCTIANLKLLDAHKLTALKYVLFAGEVMPARELRYWLEKYPIATYCNLYGPTEITVDCTYYLVPNDWAGENVPIGIACDNTDVLILDEKMRRSSRGQLGVRGKSVALGYWNAPKLTEKVFIQNPLHSNYRDIVYLTGDFVYEEEGLIYFTGRKDQQIKRSGYRIELGEIESQINTIEGVSSCVVGYNEDSNILWAVIAGEKIDCKGLVSEKLPKYMQPNRYFYCDALPLLPNGKLDRKKIHSQFAERVT